MSSQREDDEGGGDDVIEAISEFFSKYSQRGGPRGRSGERSSAPSAATQSHRSLSSSEMARLESMWKQAKRELVAQSREIATLQARVVRERNAKASAAQARQDDIDAQRSAAKQVDELRDRARFMELQFSEVKGENERLRLSYNEALMKLGESLRVLEEKASIHAQMSTFISSLEMRIAALTEQGDSLKADRDAIVAHSLNAMQEHDAALQVGMHWPRNALA
jgi:chromosome segregation ATPase